MLICKKNLKPLFYIHIPRTGGRYVKNLFEKNEFEVSLYEFDNFFEGKEIPHLHYPYYNKFTNNEKIPQFTIVRNPIDRFISILCASSKKDKYNLDIEKIFYNEESFFNFVNYHIIYTSNRTNWFLPQIYFIGPNCKIWRFEKGLNENFFNWLKVNYEIDIFFKEVIYQKDYYDLYEKIKLKNNFVNLIKKYYLFDFKILDY